MVPRMSKQKRTSKAAPPVADASSDTAKRRQILDGARAVFLAHGFEGASMNEVARVAGVSKGTLYVYYKSKERLFAAIIAEERATHVYQIFNLDHDNPDVAGVLMDVGVRLTEFLVLPRAVSAARVVMGMAEKMPELTREFYDQGPYYSQTRLAAYLEARMAAGQLRIEDTRLAAAQFLEMSHGPLVKPMFFGNAPAPTPRRIREVVASAVRVFMAAYGTAPMRAEPAGLSTSSAER